jgi:Cu(I)/Ag(I) efflux system membrane fusion protein
MKAKGEYPRRVTDNGNFKKHLADIGGNKTPAELTPFNIDQIKRDRKVPDTVTWPAPRDGVILERNAVEGQGFKAGDVLFRIADHSVVWVMADVAEGDLGALKPGQLVKVTSRAHPGRVFPGKVAVIYPHLRQETRTVRVRIELPNPDLALLPDMYVDVDIAAGSDSPLSLSPAP